VRRTLSLLLTLAAAGPLWAASLKIPAEVPAQPGRWLVLSPDTDCVAVDYVGYDGLEPFPSSELKDARKLVVQAPAAAGRFRFTAIGTLKDELARCDFVVVVGDAPPGPVPGPSPPNPADPFSKAVQDAYAADPDPQKAAHVAYAAAVYGSAAKLADLPDVKTYADLLAKLTTALHDPTFGMPKGSIAGVLKVVAADEAAVLGTNAGAAVDKDKTRAEFAKIAAALKGVK
jgi:hypothetical protein